MAVTRFPAAATRAVRGDRPQRALGGPLLTPLVQSTTFERDGVHADSPHAYSRVSNPTVDALERQLGALEDAPPAVCFSSGLAAETALLFATLRSGDHALCAGACYGGTVRLLERIFAPFGVESTFVDATDLDAVASALRPTTQLIFVETPANPTLALTDIAGVARLARRAGALLAVDNTFLTAIAQRPLDLGADVAVYSTTKIIEGHSSALGGAVVTRDRDLDARLRFVRKSTGAIQTPDNAWRTIQGVKTLPLRLRQQSESAARLARWLDAHDQVARVHHPGLPRFPQRDLAERQHLGVHGGVVSFELAGGAAHAIETMARLRLCSLAEHVGSVETLVTHSASMTHADVSPEHRARVGVTDGLIRLSVGLEDPDDIAADLAQAIAGGFAAIREERAACATTI